MRASSEDAQACWSGYGALAQRDEGLLSRMEGFQGECVDIVGWYSFQYEGGEFAVCFRPGGKFFCSEYQAPATWVAKGDEVMIDWKSYGE